MMAHLSTMKSFVTNVKSKSISKSKDPGNLVTSTKRCQKVSKTTMWMNSS